MDARSFDGAVVRVMEVVDAFSQQSSEPMYVVLLHTASILSALGSMDIVMTYRNDCCEVGSMLDEVQIVYHDVPLSY